MREIVLDTETTGLEPSEGHRLVEIGCVELINHVSTGRNFHVYINPQREVEAEAAAVHGLTTEFLSDKPVFAEVVNDFRAFIGDDKLVIHNATFDMRFLNHELTMHGFPTMPSDRAIDTLAMVRQRFPGAPASLDALCRRFGIDNSGRTLHGALLDAQLLAEVYLELQGGRQPGLILADNVLGGTSAGGGLAMAPIRKGERREPRVFTPTPEELEAHSAMVGKLKNPIWEKLRSSSAAE
ncbi:DNA polymerase III subunit epsilon [Radicibacter daui]|uniref:DNA polymerase III subunit epsilon n=1 Tax=Radicibacter daui TaxID=3064829 RepID=UPI004046E53E